MPGPPIPAPASGEENLAIQRVRSQAQASFADFANKRAALTPTFLRRAARDSWGALFLLRMLSAFPLGNFRAAGKRYVFLSGRNDDLVQAFSGHEAAIAGKGSDLLLSHRLRMPFCFLGDLYAAAHGVLFGRRMIPESRIIRRWMRFFSRQQTPCYLVVSNDTSPISLLLTRIAQQCANMRVVCIQHGLFNAGFEDDAIEGRNSDINLVYDLTQAEEMCRRLPGSVVEVMGFPTNLPKVSRPGTGCPRVMLVGTGMMEHPLLYAHSLAIFANVSRELLEQGIDVEYRPHPAEPPSQSMRALGVAINQKAKKELLHGGKMVFVGFTSTLLYEANLFGHPVIILDDELVPGYSISNFATRISAADLAKVTERIIEAWRTERSGLADVPELRIRFEAALDRAEASIDKGKRNTDT